jgi:hypothetical protein
MFVRGHEVFLFLGWWKGDEGSCLERNVERDGSDWGRFDLVCSMHGPSFPKKEIPK